MEIMWLLNPVAKSNSIVMPIIHKIGSAVRRSSPFFIKSVRKGNPTTIHEKKTNPRKNKLREVFL